MTFGGMPQAVATTVLSIGLLAALCAVLVLVAAARRRPSTAVLLPAAIIVLLALLTTAVADVRVPVLVALPLAVLSLTAAVAGGGPVTRYVLRAAAGSRVTETEDGGIVVAGTAGQQAAAATLLRGGRVIGDLERVAATICIVVGYPAAIAVIIALKSVGRFTELTASEARERFIIGTMASLTWACAIGAMVRLAVW